MLTLEPYEILGRVENRVLKGIHLQFLEVLTNPDGSVVSMTPGPVMNPTKAEALGFPLSVFFDALLAATVKANDALTAENAKLTSEIAAMQPSPGEAALMADLRAKDANTQLLLEQIATLQAQLAAAQQQLAALQPPVV